ncbi:LysR family transcriptional regulator [Methylovirgula sp. 4M-Z18]|uniref:LysR family transcriptional regulator n=1 Tax=Methylovirgula sp. 4M-Z18 TaxID=2293567 RepID=UPI000E2F3FB8|nr:LysR family transcriptional regulator [Methylovirgula sp. 4M-Z18]RFB79056.1 LysR family transcriptional regulator [Methylovirgula sp. 4M-Z18]
MLDGLSIDQLRTFIAAADEGSFSAAGRRLKRAQSVVSQTLANLEAQLGVQLFDRNTRFPVLTDAGRALLVDAREVAARMDLFKARAKGLAGGLEAELSVVVDVMFPIRNLTCAVAAFQAEFPATPLRLYVETLGAVVPPIADGRSAFGITGSIPLLTPQFSRERLLGVRIVMVAAAEHPLAAHNGPIPTCVLAKHLQLVLTDRSDLSQGRDFGVFSPRTWRLADLGAKHAFLRAGLGWGGMPYEAVKDDLEKGALVEIAIEDAPVDGYVMTMSAVYRTDSPPGPSGRWLIERLKDSIPHPDKF